LRIERIELRRYAFPLDPPFHAAWDPVPRERVEATLVLVHTDAGLVGVGSGDTMDGFERFEHLFVGHDPLDVERHARVLETIAFHASRFWPLEAALWDLAGKAAGRPVAELLGGSVRPLPVYASTGEACPPEVRVERALAARDDGFPALKLRLDRRDLPRGRETVRAVVDELGSNTAILVDLNQGWRMPGDLSDPLDRDAVVRLAHELAELGVVWLEEPLPLADVDGLRALRAHLRTAGGEMVRTPAELEWLLDADALDVIQPDAVLAVGLLRAAELAREAQARGKWFTPHTWTNGIGLVANLHVAAAVGAGPFVELPYDPPGWTPERRDWMLAEPLVADDGRIDPPPGAGLGLVLDEERLEAYRVA
jgi:D-galactarolactone cycloisomerase